MDGIQFKTYNLNAYWIAFAILVVVACITTTFLIYAIIRKDSIVKNPYYACKSDWTCCAPGNDGCDTAKSTTGNFKVASTYFPADNWKEGSAYHQNCVLPVQNAILNYEKTPNATFDFTYLYEGGTIPPNNPSVYYPGCTGPGGTGVCADPKLNPQFEVGSTGLVCPYSSFDSPSSALNSNGTLRSGASTYSNGATVNYAGWAGNIASPYIAGTNGATQTPGNNYTFPYTTKNGESFKGQYTGGNPSSSGGFSAGNTQLNTFYFLPVAQNSAYNGNGAFFGTSNPRPT